MKIGVTEVTIRNRYKEMIDRLDLDKLIEAAKEKRAEERKKMGKNPDEEEEEKLRIQE